jgi:hypothetical protein
MAQRAQPADEAVQMWLDFRVRVSEEKPRLVAIYRELERMEKLAAEQCAKFDVEGAA